MGDLIISVILILISFFAFLQTTSFPELNVNDPGPAFFPRILVVLLFTLALFLMGTTLIKKSGKVLSFNEATKKVGISIFILIIFYLALEMLGFIIATPLFLLILIRLSGGGRLAFDALISVGFTLIIYIVFQILLKVPLPSLNF
ncbi:tripartite tricarboxylate transporter TctB family protein [Thermoanaerobacterium sp. DL9XJH110]|uniref:tripartite tricarboxylate transporter TctB family protein n=1 Tax=Thermoanaerobacterium sp. DL9XJH110 TaxID=3386643 RepID=UPI003BB64450